VTGPDAIDPVEAARLLAAASDEELAAGMEANGELILAEIFRQMPGRLDAAAAGGVSAVIEWQVTGVGKEDVRRWQVVIREGSCEVLDEGTEDPSVVFRLGPVDFVRLVTGGTNGPKLFLLGRLRIEGDLLLAARVPGFFVIPRA